MTLRYAAAAGRPWLWPVAALTAAWVVALAGRGAVGAAASLYWLADTAQPYFVPDYAGLLYIWSPLVVVSACLIFIAPGLVLSLALGAGGEPGEWVVSGLALSLVVVSAAAAVAQWLMGQPVRGAAFAAVVAGCTAASLGVLLARLRAGYRPPLPFGQPHAGATLTSMIVMPALALVVLAPKFYWENFNGDGAHGYETARLLLFHALPFWPREAGPVAAFPGVTSMLFAFPAAWFIRFFGEWEVAARLPWLLYLAALFGAIVALAHAGGPARLRSGERWLIWIGLATYAVVMAYSATYNPYSADIALPATQDTLLVVCFMGYVLAFVKRAFGWMALYLALTFVSLPNGLPLIGLWLLAVGFTTQPRPWRPIGLSVLAVTVCLAAAAAAPHLLAAWRLPQPGWEYNLVNLLKDAEFVQWADWRRLTYFVVPGGILPAVSLLAWRWHDRVSRAVGLVALVYFAAFYVKGHVALHHFVPAMLLPLAAFWRSQAATGARLRKWTLGAAGLAGLAAVVVSLPQNWTLHTSYRLVGSTIDDRTGGYAAMDPAAFRTARLFRHLFTHPLDASVPELSYGAAPHVLLYYARRGGQAGSPVNYVLQYASDPAPAGMIRLAEREEAVLYIRSESIWAGHRALRPPTPAGSRLYAIPRSVLFAHLPQVGGPPIIRVTDLAEQVEQYLNRLRDRLKTER